MEATEDVKDDVQSEGDPIELTEREIAIAQGEDPDEIQHIPEQEQDAPVEGGMEAAAAVQEEAPASDEDSAGGSAPDEGEDGSWQTDSLKELAKSYGMSEDVLKQYGSAEELSRAFRLADAQIIGLGRVSNEQPAQPGQAQPPSGEPPAEVPALVELDPQKFIDEGYDENTVELVKGFVQQRETIKRLEATANQFSQFQQDMGVAQNALQRSQALNDFHDKADAMDEERFGRSLDADGKVAALSQEHEDRRRILWQKADEIKNGIVRQAQLQGVPPQIPSTQVLLHRAEQQAFSEDIRKQDRATYQQKLKAQSNTRRPSGSSKPTAAAAVAQYGDESERLSNLPEIIAAFEKASEPL